jgi:hypothetical protein
MVVKKDDVGVNTTEFEKTWKKSGVYTAKLYFFWI